MNRAQINKHPQHGKQSAYVPFDFIASRIEQDEGVQGGESCRVDEMKNIFAWMRGFINGWYGWANDGKGTFFDFMAVLKSKVDGWKWVVYKPEDMDSVFSEDNSGKRKAEIKANRIYKNLAWSLTGKTWNKAYATKHFSKQMTRDEEREALDFITEHFFVIHPADRHYKNILDEFKSIYDEKGIDGFLIDPWNAVKLDEGQRGDERLVDAFMEIKEFALLTNTVFNIVNHPRSMTDVKDGKGKDAPYKVVNQFMQLGGSAWDMKMDMQMSIYRPERHLKPSDPKVKLYNLKTRQAEIVGVERGEYGNSEDGQSILFMPTRKQYYFNGICPMDGSMTPAKQKEMSGDNMFTRMQPEPFTPPVDDGKTPF